MLRLYLALVVTLAFMVVSQSVQSNNMPAKPTWSILRVGAGGFITGIDISHDGAKVVKTDTYGAWYYNVGTSLWQQCVTMQSMPTAISGIGRARGVYAIAISSRNSRRLYMMFDGYVLRSDDRCGTWSLTNFPRDTADFANSYPENDGFRTYGRKMAVDPSDDNIVYVGTPSLGVFVTRDGGETWHSISDVPIAYSKEAHGGHPGYAIAFDPNSSVVSGHSQGVYIASYGTGVYHSSDGGEHWALTDRTPTTFHHMIVDQGGTVWLCDDSEARQLLRYTGSWLTIPGAGRDCHSIAVNPSNANDIFVGTDSGKLVISSDGGRNWTGPISGKISASDIPWLAWANDTWLSNGDMEFDPTKPGVLYFAEGTGVLYAKPSRQESEIHWVSQSAGIEQLVANWIISPPGGQPIVASWDRPAFKINNPDIYPARYGINNSNEIQHGASCDWASTSPSSVVCIANTSNADSSGFSRDGGSSWKTFPALPAEIGHNYYGGAIAASTADNLVWVPANCGNPFYTTDAGASWTKITIPGVPQNDCGWDRAYYLDRQIVVADRVKPHTFYMYNDGSATSGAAGIWKSVDGGATWTRVISGPRDQGGASQYNAQMRSVPGQAGDFYFTSGWQSGKHPNNQPFWECTDDGITAQCRSVPNVKEVFSFGFGKAAPGKSYPTVFVYGWVNDVLGIWRSDDHCLTWVRISDGFPNGSFDSVKVIEGDNNTYGKLYVGFAGSGYAYGTLR